MLHLIVDFFVIDMQLFYGRLDQILISGSWFQVQRMAKMCQGSISHLQFLVDFAHLEVYRSFPWRHVLQQKLQPGR